MLNSVRPGAARDPREVDPEPDDAAVLRESWEDGERFAVLYDRHAPPVHRFVARRLGSEPADDVVAETFLAAFRARHRYDLVRPHGRNPSRGWSRIFRLTYADQAYIGLAKQALELWRELETVSGQSLLTLTGGIDHGDRASIEPLAAALAVAGTPGEWLRAEEARERWPGFRFDTGVFHHAVSGRVHADHAVTALQEVARARGSVVLHRSPATSIRIVNGDRVEVRTTEQTFTARRVVVAAGAWTAHVLGGLIKLPPLRVTQEQPAHYAVRPGVPGEADWPSFVHHHPGIRGGVYGLGTPGEGVKVGFHAVGPVVDPDERDFRPRPHLADELDEYVRAWRPGADPATAVPMSCTYTSTPNSRFVLGRRGPLVVATGFSGHGFKFVPAVGRVLAGLAVDDDLLTTNAR